MAGDQVGEFQKQGQQLLREAAQETWAEMDRMLERLPPPLKPYFAEVRERVFEPRFGAHLMPEGILEELKLAIGESVSRMITWARKETGARLLRDTDLSVAKIAELTGFVDAPGFRKALKRWYPLPPSALRVRLQEAESRIPQSTFDPLAPRLSHRLAAGRLDPGLRPRLSLWLRTLYPLRSGARKEPSFEELMAEELWRALGPRPTPEQLAWARDEVGFASLSFFRLLGKKVIEESRKDRQRGIAVAKLAQAWLDTLPSHLEPSRPGLEALAWAWLGNAHRLAENFGTAERCFESCDCRWEELGFEIEAEICCLKGALRFFRRRFTEARALLDRALVLSRALGLDELQVRGLLLRSSVIGASGDPLTALPDHYEAISLAKMMNVPELNLTAHQDLAASLTRIGRFREAREPLAVAQRLCAEHGHPLVRHQLELLEGMVLHGLGEFDQAAEAFEKARTGMLRLKLRGYVALVSLEFSLLRFHQGRFADATALASEALPLFGAQGIDREARVALAILRESILAERLTEEILLRARDQLRRLSLDPTSSFAKGI